MGSAQIKGYWLPLPLSLLEVGGLLWPKACSSRARSPLPLMLVCSLESRQPFGWDALSVAGNCIRSSLQRTAEPPGSSQQCLLGCFCTPFLSFTQVVLCCTASWSTGKIAMSNPGARAGYWPCRNSAQCACKLLWWIPSAHGQPSH